MTSILVAGEDALSCALGEQLIKSALPGWSLAGPSINTQGVTKLIKNLPRYATQARYLQPMLCVADTDGGCALQLLRAWRPAKATPNLIIRLAVAESECWAMANRSTFAEWFGIPANKIPHVVDEVPDPKQLVLTLFSRSNKRLIRDETVSTTDRNKPGSGYNHHLTNFVLTEWDADDARRHSPSLNRAWTQLHRLGD
ncbi:MAG: hypothetical protein QM674_01935 [Burkholderiaceae bacterium]